MRKTVFALSGIFSVLVSLAGCGPCGSPVAPKSPSQNNASPSTPSPDAPKAAKAAESPQTQNATAVTADAAPAWKELFDGKTLTGWKITKFGNEGAVKVEDGTILMEKGNDMTGVTWTGEPPQENYELELEGMRVREHDFFCTTTFPVGKAFCSLVVGGWGGSVVGISSIDGNDASENATTKTMTFKENQWYRVRIRVTEKTIHAWIDDHEVVRQPREGHRFSTRWEVDLSKPLGIATWNTVGAVRNIRLRQLSAEEIAAGKKDLKDEEENF
jgi:hypothetical protein